MFLKSNDEFIQKLTEMYDACQDKSAVWITFKRVMHKEKKEKKPIKQDDNVTEKKEEKKEKPKKVLPEGSLYVRAKTDKKKIATGVLLKDLVKFQVNLAVLCKNKMQGLKRSSSDEPEKVEPKKVKKETKKL